MSMPGIQAEPVAVHGAAFNPWTVRRREDGVEEAAPYHEFVTFGEKHVKWCGALRASDGGGRKVRVARGAGRAAPRH